MSGRINNKTNKYLYKYKWMNNKISCILIKKVIIKILNKDIKYKILNYNH